jgi:phosphotransacetylase
VALTSKDGHSQWLNSAALLAAGIGAGTPDPPGGQILRDASGEPTGIVTENAIELVTRALPPLSDAALDEALRLALGEAARWGLTSVHNCESAREFAALSLVITGKGAYFLADTHVQVEPSAGEIADMTIACADHVQRFGIVPKIALISHGDFGSSDTPSACKMRDALALLDERAPGLEVDGEMSADTALSEMIRERIYPGSRLKGEANVLIMPNLDAANIAFDFIKILADALPVGPILIGPAKPAHVLTPSVTARGIVNLTAVAVVEAQG